MISKIKKRNTVGEIWKIIRSLQGKLLEADSEIVAIKRSLAAHESYGNNMKYNSGINFDLAEKRQAELFAKCDEIASLESQIGHLGKLCYEKDVKLCQLKREGRMAAEWNKIWSDNLETGMSPRPEERICVECAHVEGDVRPVAKHDRHCKRHKFLTTGNYIACEFARKASDPNSFSDQCLPNYKDCGPKGRFWTPKGGAE